VLVYYRPALVYLGCSKRRDVAEIDKTEEGSQQGEKRLWDARDCEVGPSDSPPHIGFREGQCGSAQGRSAKNLPVRLAKVPNEPVSATTSISTLGAVGQRVTQECLIGRHGVALPAQPIAPACHSELRKRGSIVTTSSSQYHCSYDFFAVAHERPGI
jgi:hypothetical protein